MLGKFSLKFPIISNNQISNFTVLKGCDDYIQRLARLTLDPEKMLKTTLITADFGDAYTETGIKHIQKSVSEIGDLIGEVKDKVDPIRKLVELVFSNCYFYTPFGLFRQARGMPMGDVSSRDSLDIDLTNSEFKILSSISDLALNVHLYCRLVDDISAVVQGEFTEVVSLVELMALNYPDMPLNVQLSFGYSRFLDCIYLIFAKMNKTITNLYILWCIRIAPALPTQQCTPTSTISASMPLSLYLCTEFTLVAQKNLTWIIIYYSCPGFSRHACRILRWSS